MSILDIRIKRKDQARALGDCLVVALHDDASMRLLKGARRPLLPYQERAHILVAFACVDEVTIFSEAPPLTLRTHLCPHVLVKGGDASRATPGSAGETPKGGQCQAWSYDLSSLRGSGDPQEGGHQAMSPKERL